MNTTAQALVFAVASVATAAAIGLALAEGSAQPAVEIVKLERVVIVGKRVDPSAARVVAKLPRVVIEGRRTVLPEDVQVADAKPVVPAL